MSRVFLVEFLRHVPQGAISRAWGWLARCKRPRLMVSMLKHGFVRATGVDLKESEQVMREFECLEDLFVRRLRPGARRIDPDPSAVACPVDGTVGACGTVTEGTLLQVKGREYKLSRLLADEHEARRFEGGPYATIYLAPHNYHRIHAPVSGEIHRALVVPGALMPVFRESVAQVDELFARNERLIAYIESEDIGRLAIVNVGATLVGRISVDFDEDLRSNDQDVRERDKRYLPPISIHKGRELGAFELGSTVVLVGQQGRIDFGALSPGGEVSMGQRIGTIAAQGGRAPRRSGRAAKPSRSDNKEEIQDR